MDRGTQFATGMMKELNQMLGINMKLSTAYYLQTDGQMERMNQDLEQYFKNVHQPLTRAMARLVSDSRVC